MKILHKLQELLGDSVQENVPLALYSTFKLGGPARYFFVAKKSDDVIKAAKAAAELKLNIFVLAGGSNLLISDAGFTGLVIKAENKNISLDSETTITAEGGASWNGVVTFAADNALTGVEWGIGIPGTVGGAVRGNAGAFGGSVQQIVKTVEAIKIYGREVKIINLNNDECQFEYRESIFKKNKNYIILNIVFQLEKGYQRTIKAKMESLLSYRRRTQPTQPSAGCTFKNIIVTDDMRKKILEINPEGEQKIKDGKIGAGWFVDQAGLKGRQIGGVKVANEHANFIVKIEANAKSSDVLMLISYIKQQVRDRFGIQLQEEVQYVGF